MNETAVLENSIPSFHFTDSQLMIIVTLILVGVTAYYAVQTKTVNEMKKASELSILPFLKPTLNQIGPVALDLMIQNIGNGPAQNIKLEYELEGKIETQKKYEKILLKPNEKEEFFIPISKTETQTNYEYFKNNKTILNIKGEYEDVLGKSHTCNDKINVTEYVKQMESNKVRYVKDGQT